ncbi:YlxR family protein [Arthrobacter agilis]|nr:YlxR family protein [Arthrobacter agilis]WDF34392.1 YlxR family protein [Arthrobacter agilis]
MKGTDVDQRPEGSSDPVAPGLRTEGSHLTRTCVGCRRRDHQSHVMRVVARPIDGRIIAVIDERRRLSGRGAWLHPDPACMETAIKRRAFTRAFRGPVDVAQLAADFPAYLERRTGRPDSPPSSLKAGQYPHGNPMRTQR